MTEVRHAGIKKKLRAVKLATRKRIARKHPQVVNWLKSRGIKLGNLRKHSTGWMAGAAMASAVLLNQIGVANIPTKFLPTFHAHINQPISYQKLSAALKHLLPDTGVLDNEQSKVVSETLNLMYGVRATAELDGNRLNQQYGRMGKEQHLKRFPGDRVSLQGEHKESGMAAHVGAWGYFADSKKGLTAEDIMNEKYYVAVQTLYLPDWRMNFKDLREWYKYRKVLVVNPENGKAVVAVIGDAGPARWTGKVFGGSPEVVEELKLNESENRGKVLLLFVDDPNNQVPLGPINETNRLPTNEV